MLPTASFSTGKFAVFDRLDLHGGELRIRQINAIAIALRRGRPIALLGIGRRRTKLGIRGLLKRHPP